MITFTRVVMAVVVMFVVVVGALKKGFQYTAYDGVYTCVEETGRDSAICFLEGDYVPRFQLIRNEDGSWHMGESR